MLENAKPCPFCASSRLRLDCSHVGNSIRVRCRNCEAMGPWIFKGRNDTSNLAQECVERWNYRKSSDGFMKGIRNDIVHGTSARE